MTKLALVTTTIRTPAVLSLYRQFTDAPFYVAGDEKTPIAALDFCNKLSNCRFLSWHEQVSSNWRTSKQLLWNTITRRNIAVLEALKDGADIIVTVDDDNIPLHSDYFLQFSTALSTPFAGILASSTSDWFDPGQLLQPVAPHRGFPHGKKGEPYFESVIDAKVGVAAGACMGDPDIGAVDRLANGPIVHGTSCLLQAGIVVDPRETWTVFNTQNTAYRRELAPAMLLCPHFGRYDDIVASLIAQRVMAGLGWHVRQGQPFVWQQRNEHDLIKDLAYELWGLRSLAEIARCLERCPVKDDPFDAARSLWLSPAVTPIHEFDGVYDLIEAWFYDCEKVL